MGPVQQFAPPTHDIPISTMKVSAIVAALMALAGLAAGAPQQLVSVTRDDSVAPVGAVFRTDFALDNGVSVQEEGQPGIEGQANHAGSYSFTDPATGETFTVNFVADERGFQPTGDHLPVAPPLPPHAIAQIEFAAEQARLGL